MNNFEVLNMKQSCIYKALLKIKRLSDNMVESFSPSDIKAKVGMILNILYRMLNEGSYMLDNKLKNEILSLYYQVNCILYTVFLRILNDEIGPYSYKALQIVGVTLNIPDSIFKVGLRSK